VNKLARFIIKIKNFPIYDLNGRNIEGIEVESIRALDGLNYFVPYDSTVFYIPSLCATIVKEITEDKDNQSLSSISLVGAIGAVPKTLTINF